MYVCMFISIACLPDEVAGEEYNDDGQFLHHLEVDVAAGWLIVKQQPLDKVVCDEIKSSLPHIK